MEAFTAADSKKVRHENQVERCLLVISLVDKRTILKFRLSSSLVVSVLAMLSLLPRNAAASSCVWKVSGPNGGTLYLGGSVHALRSSDYPLPAGYNNALNASSRLVFEDDPKAEIRATKELLRAGTYPKGDSLKNHVDPRTYKYLRRFFALVNVPEETFSKYRPWLINIVLSSPSSEHWRLGVEQYLQRQAKGSKSISGLESPREHNSFFIDLNDREAEALLLILFINAGQTEADGGDIMRAWRRGDADALSRIVHNEFRDFPSLGRRLVDQRNQNWVPKIEEYLRSGRTYFVVAGAGHMGGPNGLLALLRGRGYTIEQL
jgi:hypothetical protein